MCIRDRWNGTPVAEERRVILSLAHATMGSEGRVSLAAAARASWADSFGAPRASCPIRLQTRAACPWRAKGGSPNRPGSGGQRGPALGAHRRMSQRQDHSPLSGNGRAVPLLPQASPLNSAGGSRRNGIVLEDRAQGRALGHFSVACWPAGSAPRLCAKRRQRSGLSLSASHDALWARAPLCGRPARPR